MPDIGLAGWFRRRALRSPARLALRFEGQEWTYADMQREIEQCAARLIAQGVGRGDRVAFLGLNQPMFFFSLFAAARLGAVFVPLNFRLTGPELAFMLDDSGACLLIVDAQHAPVLAAIALRTVRARLPAEAPERWADGAPSAAPEPVDAAADDLALIMYTSGTTGSPKGAMLTHGNLWWSNVNMLHACDVLQDDITLVAAPVFHIGGLNVLTLVTWQKGGLVVLHRGFKPEAALADLAAHRVTTMFGVPAMFQFMAQHPAFDATDLSSVRLLAVGGAPCPLPVLTAFLNRGISLQQGYGMTETAPAVSFLASEHALTRVGSSGPPCLLIDLKLVDRDDGEIRTPGVPGEILVRGPNVTAGYWNRPEATCAAIDADGWFRTGDAAYADADGFITICDRIKDMIISGGENIYPAEVESGLMRHPAIAEVAVIGEPDETWGERVVAVVVLKPGARLTLAELSAFAGEFLARYKLPRRLQIVDTLPRNATGKLLKYRLREMYQAAPAPADPA